MQRVTQHPTIATKQRSPIFRAEWWAQRSSAADQRGAAVVGWDHAGVHPHRGRRRDHHYVHGFSDTVVVQLVLYLFAISLVERCPANRWTLGIILLIALAERLVAVAAHPFSRQTSTAMCGTAWCKGPASIRSAISQRTRIWLFCVMPVSIRTSTGGNMRIRFIRRDRRSSSGRAATRISPTVTAMKLAMVGFEAVTCYALIRCLKLLHMQPERVLLYAWHPVCLWEIASSGHADAAAVTFISLALLARLTNRDTLSGGWLGAAALVWIFIPSRFCPHFCAEGDCVPHGWRSGSWPPATHSI